MERKFGTGEAQRSPLSSDFNRCSGIQSGNLRITAIGSPNLSQNGTEITRRFICATLSPYNRKRTFSQSADKG
ncbi:hypothetical protein [Paenibacillus albidus]|uniref:hypothetical protein n=1 Tax=Paenibacillus albidus TaxID=2041023 RepID=UPI0016665406|nr:hypothetical protein [Paenibacillus albidus]